MQLDFAFICDYADSTAKVVAVQGNVAFVDPADRLETTATLVINFDNLTFNHYGPYATHVLLDGNEMHRMPFEVSQPPAG